MGNFGFGQLLASGTLFLLFCAGTLPLEGASWHQIITDFGFPVALVMFFVWNGWKREERIAASMASLDAFVRTQLLEINNKSIQSMADNTRALLELVRTLELKPCLLTTEHTGRWQPDPPKPPT